MLYLEPHVQTVEIHVYAFSYIQLRLDGLRLRIGIGQRCLLELAFRLWER